MLHCQLKKIEALETQLVWSMGQKIPKPMDKGSRLGFSGKIFR